VLNLFERVNTLKGKKGPMRDSVRNGITAAAILLTFALCVALGIFIYTRTDIIPEMREWFGKLSVFMRIVLGCVLIVSAVFISKGINYLRYLRTKELGVFTLLTFALYGSSGVLLYNHKAVAGWLKVIKEPDDRILILGLVLYILAVTLVIVSECVLDLESKVARVLTPMILCSLAVPMFEIELGLVSNIIFLAAMLVSQIIILVQGDSGSEYSYSTYSDSYTNYGSDYRDTSVSYTPSYGSLSKEANDIWDMEIANQVIRNINTPGYEPDGAGGLTDSESFPPSDSIW
jgi:hypothetical protein